MLNYMRTKMSSILKIISLAVLMVAGSATAATYTVSSPKSSGSGTLRWAVEQANLNSGHDIVEVPAKFDAKNPIVPGTGASQRRFVFDNPILITDDITIRGLGSSRPVVDDHQHWITTEGYTNTGYPFSSGSTVLRPVGTLFRVNRNNGAGRTLDVIIENLTFTHMSTFINSDNANVVLDNTEIHNFTAQRSSDLLMVHGGGGSLTIKDSLVYSNQVENGQQHIVINNDLVIINSAFSANSTGARGEASSRLIKMAVIGNAIIRDSYFEGLSNAALEFQNVDVEITNTLFDGRDAIPTRGIRVTDGDLTLTNNTLFYTSKTNNVDPDLFRGTHLELAGTAQLIANNNLFISTDSQRNTLTLIYPEDWDDTAQYPRAVNQNNYISAIGGDDSALNWNPLACYDRKCFIPNALSTPILNMGNNATAVYGDGTPIIVDYLKELRPQGAAIEIGAYEKHETLDPHADHYITDEGVTLSVDSANGVLANDTTPSGLSVTLSKPALHGTVLLYADGSFDYTPKDGYSGHDEFEYALGGKNAVASIEVRSSNWLLIPQNQQPTTVADNYSVYTNNVLNVGAPGLLVNDRDDQNTQEPFYQDLEARLYKAPTHGMVTISSDGGFVYIPDAGFVGFDEFYYDAVDVGSQHSVPQRVSILVKDGVAPGAKAEVATKVGAFSHGILLLLAVVALIRKSKLIVAGSLLFGVFLSQAHAQDVLTKADRYKGFTLDLGFGVAKLDPELDGTAWEQTRRSRPSITIGGGYQFNDNWSVGLRYSWVDKVELESDSPLYPPTKINYQILQLDSTYRFNQFWGNDYAPFAMLGVGYLDPDISDANGQIEVEKNTQINYGLGINLSDTDLGRIDLGWQKIAGDVDLFGLNIIIDIAD